MLKDAERNIRKTNVIQFKMGEEYKATREVSLSTSAAKER